MAAQQQLNPSAGNITVETLYTRDLTAVTGVHLAAFPDSVLTTLGSGIVKRYYEWQMRGPHSVLVIGARVDGQLAGFSFLVSRSELSGFLRRNARALLWAAITHPSVVRHGRFLSRFAQGVRSLVADLFPSDTGLPTPGLVRLLAIAVHPRCQRLRLGTRLLLATEAAATETGNQEIGLSVHRENTAAIAFYLHHGWERSSAGVVWSGEMRKRFRGGALSPEPQGAAEVRRIRTEYSRRRAELGDLYSWARPANRFLHIQIYRHAIAALDRRNMFPLNGRRIADIGCGSGTWLLEFCQWGAEPRNLLGIDLDEGRIQECRQRLPHADIVCGDAEHMPWSDSSVDIVCQLTMMTSILDSEVRHRVASEMLRILKPGGLILWYDTRIDNPGNPSVRGIGKQEIQQLFPGCGISLEPVTLAPPIARFVVPISWIAGLLLEKISLLRTHYIGIICKSAE
jgi:SAM-dependent methyltransferase/GNAT superfamily N-acetyltransferase